ncbi:MAG: alpha-1,2-fucosyltransferase [Lachnospiraceae bacterium]|nr:alpha-1,2-fucosyltransferase [Lachnospiraceae bacterium]
MLAIRIVGGLGNQLFGYALYRYLLAHGKRAKLDIGFYRHQNMPDIDKRDYYLEKYFNVNADYLNLMEKAEIYCYRKIGRYDELKYFDKGKGYEADVLNVNRGVIEGYWSTFLFAEEQREGLLRTLSLENKYEDDPLLREIKTVNSVSIHVRRGDYVKLGIDLPRSYYDEAMEYMQRKICNPRFYCFSNDIRYCKKIYGKDITFIERDDALFDLCAMSACKYNIVANSTFSAWAAWLNNNDNKIVLHPSKWYPGKESKLDERIWPEKWVCL